MQKLQAVLFDLDGTLLDSAADLRQGINLMLKDQGRPPVSIEQIRQFYGEGMMELCRLCLEATGGVKEGEDLYPYVQKFIAHYRAVEPAPEQVYPHARELLQRLTNAKVKTGICTNKQEKATVQILRSLGLEQYFGFIAGGDTFPVHKPNPGHIHGVLEALGVEPQHAVFIGDGPNDIVASVKAGIPYIVITHGRQIEETEADAHHFITEFDDFEAKLADLGFEV